MSDFKQISQMLMESGGAIEIINEDDLYRAVVEIFETEKNAQEMGTRAYGVFGDNRGAVDRTLQVIRNEIRLS